jgi:hypothetical protein
MDMDDWIAIADAESSDQEMDDDKYDEKNVDTDVEAIEDNTEDSEDYNKQLELIKNIRASPEEQYERLTYWFEPDFIHRMEAAYRDRVKELERQNLPFFNM